MISFHSFCDKLHLCEHVFKSHLHSNWLKVIALISLIFCDHKCVLRLQILFEITVGLYIFWIIKPLMFPQFKYKEKRLFTIHPVLRSPHDQPTFITVGQSMSLAGRITIFCAYFLPTEDVFVSLSRSMTDSWNWEFFLCFEKRLTWLHVNILCKGGAAWCVPWNIHFVRNCDSAKAPFKSWMSTARSVCVSVCFALNVLISNELLKSLFQEWWTLCFLGLSYYKFWPLLSAFQTGHQLQHVWIWCRGMEGHCPSQTLLRTPSSQAAQLFRLALPSQVRDHLKQIRQGHYCFKSNIS